MNESIIILFLSSFWCFGFHFVAKKLVIGHIIGMDFDKWWDLKLTVKQQIIFKPLFGCPPCMASVHGTVIFFAYFWPVSIFYWPVFCIVLCGLNHIINSMLQYD